MKLSPWVLALASTGLMMSACSSESSDTHNAQYQPAADELTLNMADEDQFQSSFDAIMETLDDDQRQRFAIALQAAANEAIEVTDAKLRVEDPDRYAICDGDEVEIEVQIDCSVWFMGEMDDWLNETLDGSSANSIIARFGQ
ncbi:MAG: hypothetical protein JJU48_03080 [Methylophaga sp.]|nr:hypothetical protein [Methylophaga sp.]